MDKDQNTKSEEDLQKQIEGELDSLLAEAEKISQETDDIRKAREEIELPDPKMEEPIKELEDIFSDLGKAEEEAGDELNRIILEEAEDLAGE